MVVIKMIIPENRSTIADIRDKQRKQYNKPQIIELGDLRTLTLGGSPGGGDSGTPRLTQIPGMISPGYVPDFDDFPPP